MQTAYDMENFIVLQRTKSEIEVFGGDVYIDIDGKNVGIVKTNNLRFELIPGKHTIKMYKSHTMGTFVGVAETEITIAEGEKLYAKYSAPLMVNQCGNILIAPFESENQLNTIIEGLENNIHKDYANQQERNEKARKESEKNNFSLIVWIIVIPIILGLLFWIIEMSVIQSHF